MSWTVGETAMKLSYNSGCPQGLLPADTASTMKAIVYRCYGSSAVLQLEDIAKPLPEDNEVLVKVRAAALRNIRRLPHFPARTVPVTFLSNPGLG